MREISKIVGLELFEDYWITDNGQIFTKRKTVNGWNDNGELKPRKVFITKRGYYQVSLFDISGRRKGITIHRLVAMAFIPNPENKPCVNHLDGNKLNNHVSNLEWCTHKENMGHASRMNLLPAGSMPNRYGKIPTCRRIAQYDLKGNKIAEYSSVYAAARALKIPSPTPIRQCCLGHTEHKDLAKRKPKTTAYGYKWCFL